jgi:trehalose/maltose hydrolase-like predicted phosphorylase
VDRHTKAWAELWNTGDIQIEGDLDAQQLRVALYNLYSFIRPETETSSTHGTFFKAITGTFWDTELWMYPTLLVMQPEMAKSCLDYRADRLDKAKQKLLFMAKGAMFPWESDDTGEEATPTWALTGIFEQHYRRCFDSVLNYYAMTQGRLG